MKRLSYGLLNNLLSLFSERVGNVGDEDYECSGADATAVVAMALNVTAVVCVPLVID